MCKYYSHVVLLHLEHRLYISKRSPFHCISVLVFSSPSRVSQVSCRWQHFHSQTLFSQKGFRLSFNPPIHNCTMWLRNLSEICRIDWWNCVIYKMWLLSIFFFNENNKTDCHSYLSNSCWIFSTRCSMDFSNSSVFFWFISFISL